MTSRADSSPRADSGAPAGPPGHAGAVLPRVEVASRALRMAVDIASLVAFYGVRHEPGGTQRVLVFWMMSLVVFPYARIAAYVGQRREAHWACFVAGAVLACLGFARVLQLFGSISHYAPPTEVIWLGLALAFAGAAHLVRTPPAAAGAASVRRLGCGLASLASGSIWLLLQMK